MSKEAYDELKSIMVDIADVVQKYPDSLKEDVYTQLLRAFGVHHHNVKSDHAPAADPLADVVLQKTSVKPKQTRKSQESFKIDSSLLLSNNGTAKSFKDFVAEKSPSNASDFTAVAVYYLTKILNHVEVSYNQVYTCYKDVNRRTPDAFKQSFTDTKNKQGFIDISDTGILKMTIRGDNHVEHDLPKPLTKADK